MVPTSACQDFSSAVVALQPMGDESSTAQVHPQKLSRALMEAAQDKGAQLRIGEVQNITTHNNAVTGNLPNLSNGHCRCE